MDKRSSIERVQDSPKLQVQRNLHSYYCNDYLLITVRIGSTTDAALFVPISDRGRNVIFVSWNVC